VIDVLSRNTQHSLNTIVITQMSLLKELEYGCSIGITRVRKCTIVIVDLIALYSEGGSSKPEDKAKL